MRNTAPVFLVVATLVLTAGHAAAAPQGQDSYAEQVATVLARKFAIDYLTDREIEIEDRQFKVVAQAVDPDENVRVEVKEMNLGFNQTHVVVEIHARFRLEGKLRREGREEPLAVRGVGDVKLTVTAGASWVESGNDPAITVSAEELACELQEIVELTPADLLGAKQLLEEGFTRHADDLRGDLNEYLTENVIRPSEAEK